MHLYAISFFISKLSAAENFLMWFKFNIFLWGEKEGAVMLSLCQYAPILSG